MQSEIISIRDLDVLYGEKITTDTRKLRIQLWLGGGIGKCKSVPVDAVRRQLAIGKPDERSPC